MNEITKTAFEFARQTTEQFITLATATIALTITFSKDFIGTVEEGARVYAQLSWGGFLLSVLFGLLTLMALTGSLEPKQPASRNAAGNEGRSGETPTGPSIRGLNVIIPSALQIVTFLFGLAMTVVFGIRAT